MLTLLPVTISKIISVSCKIHTISKLFLIYLQNNILLVLLILGMALLKVGVI